MRFPGIAAKLVRISEITRNFHGCKNYFEKVCVVSWYESNGNIFNTEITEAHGARPQRKSILPIFTIDHSHNSVAEVRDEEIDQQSNAHPA